MNNHESLSDRELGKRLATGIVKRKGTDETGVEPNTTIHNAVKRLPQTEHLQISDVRNVKRNLYSAKRQALPLLPKPVEEAQIIFDGYDE